jgi:hypothetical protein
MRVRLVRVHVTTDDVWNEVTWNLRDRAISHDHEVGAPCETQCRLLLKTWTIRDDTGSHR